MTISQDCRYTQQHEWIRVEGTTATVGITDYAQKALGDLTYVDLPKVGKVLNKGDEAVAIESCKAAASVYAPVSGKVSQANTALGNDPSLINSDPHGNGWIFKLTLDNPADVQALMDAKAYEAFLQKES